MQTILFKNISFDNLDINRLQVEEFADCFAVVSGWGWTFYSSSAVWSTLLCPSA